MEWRKHAEAYYALWPVRYLEPGEAAWKRLLDSLILYDKKGERLNYPEGRSIILQNLSTREKANMISKLPKKATYIKACFRQFWKLKLVPKTDTTAGIGTESPWHGHRVHISVTNQQRHCYCKHVLHVIVIANTYYKSRSSRTAWTGTRTDRSAASSGREL